MRQLQCLTGAPWGLGRKAKAKFQPIWQNWYQDQLRADTQLPRPDLREWLGAEAFFKVGLLLWVPGNKVWS
jgi:hypothetical protein